VRAARPMGWWLRPSCTRPNREVTAFDMGLRAGIAQGARKRTEDAVMWLQVGRRLALDPDGTKAVLHRLVERLDGDGGVA